MSTISSVNTPVIPQTPDQTQTTQTGGAHHAHHGGGKHKAQNDTSLTDELEASGLTADQASQLESDLGSAVQSVLGAGSPPDKSQIQSAVQGVFQKYGLDASNFFPPKNAQGASGGGSPIAGNGLSSYQKSDSTSSTNSLQGILQQWASSLGSTDDGSDTDQTTQDLLLTLNGVNLTA